ncbi:MAG: hypothetical protein JNK65_07240, partial [Deltaproteobacteria bacterium]|nr:hypothetical protein [Deltaproteobacteria bacterium]
MENLSTTSVSNPSLKTINPIARFILKTGVDLILLIPLSILLAIFVNSMDRPIRWLHPSLGLPVIMMSIVIIGDLIEWAYALRKYGKNKAADF